MIYFVTGASGFIGKRLVRTLLRRPDSTVFFLLRKESRTSAEQLLDYWKADSERAIPVSGDLLKPRLGLSDLDLEHLSGRVDHVFHLGAVYDLRADPDLEIRTNVEGTRNLVAFARAIRARHVHHVSSIAAAGLYRGLFREDMFEEAEDLRHPYFASKHDSERVVRNECRVPWRIYRPGIVVGDSRTGEIDKIDGPYYFFKTIQKLRSLLPAWMPCIGFGGGWINLVPVDFVVAALDHLAHIDNADGRCFHLTDPHQRRVGDVLNLFARAAHAPQIAIRLSGALLNLIPSTVVSGFLALPPVARIRTMLMSDLDLPEGVLNFFNYPTRFDSSEASRLLEPAGIRVPALEDYAPRLWDYWERQLDPNLFLDRALHDRVADRVVVVTGGSSGIGKATALRVAAAGATTIIVGRDPERLQAVRDEAAAGGLELVTWTADLTDADQCGSLVEGVRARYGTVDVLVNNAGRSIRRGIEHSYDRMHDFERMIAVNYFGALRLTLGLLPAMAEHGGGHVINISSIGVLTNAPRFSAYVASKAALEAWTRCAASEFLDRNIAFTTINMPLVRTPMIAPSHVYDDAPALTPEEAAGLVVEAIVRRPVRIATSLGIFGQMVHAASPRVAQVIMNTAFRMVPDTADGRDHATVREATSADQVALKELMRGIHL